MELAISEMTPKVKYKDYHFLSLFISVALICLTPFTTPYLPFLVFVIQIVRLVCCKAEVFFVDIVCLMPFSYIFREPGGKSLYAILIILACAFFLFTKKFEKNSIWGICVCLICYFLTRSTADFMAALPALSGILLICIATVIIKRENVVIIAKAYILSILISSIFGYIFKDSSALINYTRDPALAQYGSDAVRFKGLFTDPNYYFSCVIIAIALIIVLYISKEVNAISFVSVFGGLTVFGLITYSKTFLIVYIFTCFFYMLVSLKRKRYLIAVIFGFLFLFVLFNIMSDKLELFVVLRERFTEGDDLNSLTSGRADTWNNYLEFIFANAKTLIFGEAFNAPMLNGIGTHNLAIELLYYTGIIGLTLFVAFLCASVKNCMVNNFSEISAYKGVMKYGLIMVFVITYMSLQAAFSSVLYVQWILVCVGIIIGNNTPKRELEIE